MPKNSARRSFILDTSVLVYDPNAFSAFKNNNIVLPIAVLSELDKLKREANEVGKNARQCVRYLDEVSSRGDIIKGVDLGSGISLIIDAIQHDAVGLDKNYGDNQILGCLQVLAKSVDVCLVSRDINLRVRARAMGIDSQDYSDKNIDKDDLHIGHRVVKNMDAGLLLSEKGVLACSDYPELNDVLTNEFVLFTDAEGRGIVPGRRFGRSIRKVEDISPWGLELRNKEQLYLADLLMDPLVPLVSVTGSAGVGKTICVLAAALELVINQKKYEQILIYRPIQPMSADLGYLPGSLEEKLDPWFAAIDDAFAYLLSDGKSRNKNAWKEKMFQYLDSGVIKKEALTYIRGRSIPNALIIIDEFQNLSSEDAKSILTRAGTGSKIVMTGDIEQIDNKRLDAISNGLTYTIERFKGSKLAGHITLTKGERSELATMASEIL